MLTVWIIQLSGAYNLHSHETDYSLEHITQPLFEELKPRLINVIILLLDSR